MILGKEEILKAIKIGGLKVEPFNKDSIKGSSIDLTLDNKFRFFYKDVMSQDYKKYSKLMTKSQIVLEPGQFILGITKEKLTLKNLAGRLEGRSTFARLGITVHAASSFIHPGVSNKQVLEIKNVNNVRVKINAGDKICQVFFSEIKGNYVLDIIISRFGSQKRFQS